MAIISEVSMNVTVAELKASLSEILRKAACGEEITVTKHGKAYVTLVTASNQGKLPRLGAFRGQVWMADDFDDLGPEWDEYTK